MDAAAMLRAGRRAAWTHAGASLVLITPAVALAPAKFQRAGTLLAVLAIVLLVGGAASAHAAWAARAHHGVRLPGWSPWSRGWWAWDPPLRAFHWAMCAHALLVMWVLLLVTVAFERVTGMKVPVALDAVVTGSGEFLTGFGAALLLAVVGYLLTVRWARREVG
jgi:hypothetical protein